MTRMGSTSFPRIRIGIGAGRYIYLPVLTTTQRNALSASAGYLIYNSTTSQVEEYSGSAWRSVGQGTLTTHEAAADPHTGYALATELTTHEADTSTHGVTTIDGATERDAAIAVHAAVKDAHFSNVADISFIIDGGGSAITTGEKGHLEIPFACTINQVTMLADQSGSIVVDIWKDTYANFPPTVADTITASAKPTITTAQKSQDSTLTGWTTAIAAGDILAFKVDSITTITRVTISLKVTKS